MVCVYQYDSHLWPAFPARPWCPMLYVQIMSYELYTCVCVCVVRSGDNIRVVEDRQYSTETLLVPQGAW